MRKPSDDTGKKGAGGETLVIGTKYWSHDTAIFGVFLNSKKIFPIQTERLTRYKHDSLLPIAPVKKLIEKNIPDLKAIKKVVLCHSFSKLHDLRFSRYYYEVEIYLRKHFDATYLGDFQKKATRYNAKNTVQKIAELCTTSAGRRCLYYKMLGFARSFGTLVPLKEIVRGHLRQLFPFSEIEILDYDHEYCHIMCSSVTCPFDEFVAFSSDGWGDNLFASLYSVQSASNSVTKISESSSEIHSLGGIYSIFTRMLGFTPLSDEGKVEALAAYGKVIPEVAETLRRMIVLDEKSLTIQFNKDLYKQHLAHDKNFNLEVLNEWFTMHTKEDLSATVQHFLEKVTVDYLRLVQEKTGYHSLALSGGVAANVITNLAIYEKITKNIHITPAMGDDGSAQGAAYAYLRQQGWSLQEMRALQGPMPYYSTSYTKAEVLKTAQTYTDLNVTDLGEMWPEKTAELLAGGAIGAIFHGQMEWGPRALGNRSIIADPRQKDFRDIINRQVKRRPYFQPFCPSILAEEKDRLFESAYLNKHMTCAFRLKKEFWEKLPSAIHIDGTARVQFVEENDNPNYFRLIKKVKDLTGYGVVINTSFNKHGRTIVESPRDAITDFLDTDMDYVVIEGILIQRKTPTQ